MEQAFPALSSPPRSPIGNGAFLTSLASEFQGHLVMPIRVVDEIFYLLDAVYPEFKFMISRDTTNNCRLAKMPSQTCGHRSAFRLSVWLRSQVASAGRVVAGAT